MSDNPFQSPAEHRPVTGVRTGSIDSLKKVAQNQRGVLACLLAQILVVILQVVARAQLTDMSNARTADTMTSIALLTASIIGAIYVFRLAVNVYHPGVGVALSILAFIPCIGLLALLTINAKANNVLRQNGIRVGLMGARSSDLAALSADSP
jgi:hypothetical protein